MRRAWVPIAIMTLLIAGWSAAWVYVADRAQSATDQFIASEHAQGRDWTCPDRVIDGYPFAIKVTCKAPTFAGQSFGEAVQGTVASLHADLSLAHPQTVAIRLEPPFRYRSSTGQTDVQGTWAALDLSLANLPDPGVLTIAGRDVALTGTFSQAGTGSGKVSRLDARLADAPDRKIDFAITADGADVPALDALFKDHRPVALDLAGRTDAVAVGDAPTPEAAMEVWRRAGGHVDLAHAILTRGDAKVTATGTLALDDAHRLRGRLDASFFGLEPILARYGISGNVAAASSLISALFGGGPKKITPGALSLPISFANGRLGVGPVRTAIELKPVY